MLQILKTQKTARKWRPLICVPLLVSVLLANGQPAIPKFETFLPVSLNTGISPVSYPPSTAQVNPMLPKDLNREQNYRMMQQAGMTVPGPTNSRQASMADVKAVLSEEKESKAAEINERRLSAFQNNVNQFLQLNPDSFSIMRAVYLSESAFYDNPPSFAAFESAFKQSAEMVKQILKKEGLSQKDNLSINYAIQELYHHSNEFYDSSMKRTYVKRKFRYDLNDFLGEKDWTKMFVTKLLQTGTGQCHSLPLFYLCLAEQLNAKAYLSLSPNHSFIQFFDRNGNRYNFEATNGNLVSQSWLMGSNYVTAAALKSKVYLDTLSSRKLYAQCLGDLLLSYLEKTGHYDDFSSWLTKKILTIDPANITALMEQANLSQIIFGRELKAAGNPSENEYLRFPRLNSAFQQYIASKEKVDQTGYQQMPKEVYQAWLKSLNDEKQRQINDDERERMEREVKKLQKVHSRLSNNSRG